MRFLSGNAGMNGFCGLQPSGSAGSWVLRRLPDGDQVQRLFIGPETQNSMHFAVVESAHGDGTQASATASR